MRRALARHADAILPHNAVSRDVLAVQVALDRSRLYRLPHASYLGRHEDEATLQAALLREPLDRRIQAFGWIRLQKGFGGMIDMLPADFFAFARGPRAHQRTRPRSCGGHRPRSRATRRALGSPARPGLRASDLAAIGGVRRLAVRAHLTSAVVLLAMSVGAMIVAVDLPQLREVLPEASHSYRYPPGDAEAFRRIVDDVFALSPLKRRTILEANLAVARAVRPSTIARRLAAIYREVVATRSRSRAGSA